MWWLWFFLCCISSVVSAPTGLIELSYTFDNYTPNYPLHTKFSMKSALKGPYGGSEWVESNNICSSDHSGTHIDAPVHFVKDGKGIDQIPYSKLYRIPGVKVNVTEKACCNPDYIIGPEDLNEWVEVNGEIPDGAVVLFETGWGKVAHNPDAYSGMDENGQMHFPSLGPEAADWILGYKNKTGQVHGILGIGMDVLSFDSPMNHAHPVHVNLLKNEIYGIENMKDLDKLPPRGFTLTMLPMKIGGGSGGPARILAEIGGTPYGPYVDPYVNPK